MLNKAQFDALVAVATSGEPYGDDGDDIASLLDSVADVAIHRTPFYPNRTYAELDDSGPLLDAISNLMAEYGPRLVLSAVAHYCRPDDAS